MYTADNICQITDFSIDNIFMQFIRYLYHQVIGIPMRTNCAPLLADLFYLYSYENKPKKDSKVLEYEIVCTIKKCKDLL